MSDQARWMIYGASGFSGTLIAEEAVRRGHRPLLAGRSASKLAPLGDRLGLDTITARLDNPPALARAVDGMALVLHCAGPFVFTSLPMIRACLNAQAHYLDITGEIPVIENAFAYDSPARARQVALISGCGFDAVPTDCLAAYVAAQVTDPVELEIAFDALGVLSGGSLASGLEGAARGGLERRDGRLTALPLGAGSMTVRFPHGERRVMPIPWGDLATAYRSTGIPNITTYSAYGAGLIGLVRLFGPLGQALLMIGPLRRLARSLARLAPGPKRAAMQRGRASVWARASDVRGGSAEAWLEMVEAYRFTALSAVRCVERTLAGGLTGALTPAQAFGADFVLDIEGTRRYDTLPG